MVKHANKVKQLVGKNLEESMKRNFESILSEIPFLKLEEIKSNVRLKNKQIDFIAKVLISRKPATFIIEVKTQGEPRITRMAVSQIKSYLQNYPGSYGIFASPYFSEASMQICKEADVGYIDLAGNAFISFKNIFVDKSGRPNPFPIKRSSKSVFSPKSSRVLRVLFSDPSKKWYVEKMSQQAGISIGLTSRVKQELLSQEWVKEENKRFYLAKPMEALEQWTKNYSYEKNQCFSFYSNLNEDQLEKKIKIESDKRKWQYGLGLFSGARKVAPFVRFLRFFAYINGDIECIAHSLKLKEVESGPNVILLQQYDEGVFYDLQNINGINVVSDIQLYLDLKSYKGRGEEAARSIFEQRIKPKW